MKQITISLPNPDYEVIRSFSINADIPLSELVRRAVSDYLAKIESLPYTPGRGIKTEEIQKPEL